MLDKNTIEKMANEIVSNMDSSMMICKIAEEILEPIEKVAASQEAEQQEDVVEKIAQEIVLSALSE